MKTAAEIYAMTVADRKAYFAKCQADEDAKILDLAKRTNKTLARVFEAVMTDDKKLLLDTLEIRVGCRVEYMTDDVIGTGEVKRILEKNGKTIIRVFDPSTMSMIDVAEEFVGKL